MNSNNKSDVTSETEESVIYSEESTDSEIEESATSSSDDDVINVYDDNGNILNLDVNKKKPKSTVTKKRGRYYSTLKE